MGLEGPQSGGFPLEPTKKQGVALKDRHTKVMFTMGVLHVTSHRCFSARPSDRRTPGSQLWGEFRPCGSVEAPALPFPPPPATQTSAWFQDVSLRRFQPLGSGLSSILRAGSCFVRPRGGGFRKLFEPAMETAKVGFITEVAGASGWGLCPPRGGGGGGGKEFMGFSAKLSSELNLYPKHQASES